MTTPALSGQPGERYRVEREIGRGGMATVFLARDLPHDRLVALKLLHPELAQALGPERFLREIRIAAGLSHPNVLPLYDSGFWTRADGSTALYYTMPFVNGESLRRRLERERQLPIEDAILIAREVAGALTHAHEHGIVHRDVKPENILLEGPSPPAGTPDRRRVVLADFGIATAADAEAERLTNTGLAIGTPAYMSPEQASADRRIDARSDVYALGCVLYEMLAGQPPFTGATARAITARHALDPVPSLRSVRPAVPAWLESAVTHALAKVPADRFPSAAALARALEGRGIVLPRTWRLRRAILAGLTLAAVAGVSALVARRRAPSDVRLDPGLVAVLPFQVTDADTTLGYLREGMPDLLAVKLTGEGGPRALDPRAVLGRYARAAGSSEADLEPGGAIGIARGFGAARLIQGNVVGTASHLILTASVIGVPGGNTLSRASVAGAAENLPLLVDRLISQVLAGEEGRTELADLTSLEALRSYLAGKRAMRAGHFDEALKDFARALEVDSTFAAAALDLQETSGWVSNWLPQDYGPTGVERAWPVRDRLSPRDRALLMAHAGPRFPLPSSGGEFLEAAEQAVAAAPERAEAWYKLGDEYFHWGALLGLPHALGQAAAAFRRAEELDTAAGRAPDAGPLRHQLEIATLEEDTATVRRLGTLALADPRIEDPDGVRWEMAHALGDSATLTRLRARFDSMSLASLQTIALQSQELGLALEDGRQAVDAMLARAKTEDERRYALAHLYGLSLNGGRPAQARVAVRRSGGWPEWYRPMDDALFWGGDSSAGAEQFQKVASVAEGPPAHSPRGAAEHHREICAAGVWRLSLGDPRAAPSAVARLRGAIPHGSSVHDSSRIAASSQICAALLEAWWATATGRPEAPVLVLRLDSLTRTSPHGWGVNWNLVLARLLEAHGHQDRALAAVRRRVFGMVPRGLATFLREEGRLAALRGDTTGAIAAYRHYLALRPDPEPSVLPQVDQVRSELAALVAEAR